MQSEQFKDPAWNKCTPRLRRRLLLTVLKDLVLLTVLVVVGEFAVRLFLPEYNQLRFTPTITGGHPKVVNSRGLRDREFPIQRPDKETRILCLGNSTTFGAGVAMDETYPKQLERMLNGREEDDPYFVINAGGEGRSLGGAITFLKNTGLSLDPALVILGYSSAMMERARRNTRSANLTPLASGGGVTSMGVRAKRAIRGAALRTHGMLYASYLYVFFDTNVRRRLYRIGVLRDRLDKPVGGVFAFAFDDPGVSIGEVEGAYSDFTEHLAEIRALLDDRGVRLLVLGIPLRFRIGDLPVDNERGFDMRKIRIEPLDRITGYCKDAEIAFVDLRPRLRGERQAMLNGGKEWDDLYIPLDYVHLNRRGLQIAAEELSKTLDDHAFLPRRATR